MSLFEYPSKYRLYDTQQILDRSGSKIAGIGSETEKFQIITGSKLIFTLQIISLDSGASIKIDFKSNFSVSSDFPTIDSLESNSVETTNKIITDFHNLFQLEITVTGGNVEYKLGLSVHDGFKKISSEDQDEIEPHILVLMQSYLDGITYDEIRKEIFDGYRLYDLYNNETPIGISLKVFYEDNKWRVQSVDTEFLLGTLINNELLVQENSDAIELES